MCYPIDMSENSPPDFTYSEFFEKAKNAAIRKISRREHSSGDVLAHLIEKGYGEALSAEVVAHLIEKNWLNDQRFAEVLVRYQASRGKGPSYIRNKLREKKLQMNDEEILSIVAKASGKTEVERAKEIVERRYPGYREDFKIAQKAFAALVRRGFSFEIARQATSKREERLD